MTAADGTDAGETPASPGRGFWVAAVVGWAVVAYGVWGMFDESGRTNPASLLWWMAGGLVVHDLVWLPLALLAGAAVGRWMPASARAPVGWVLAVSAMLLVVGYPFIAGKGRRDDIPSLLNRNYGRGVAVYIVVIAAVGIAWWLAARRREDRVPTGSSATGAVRGESDES